MFGAGEAEAQEESCPGGPGQIILDERGGDVSANAQGFANYGPFTVDSDSFVARIDATAAEPGAVAFSVNSLSDTPNPLVIRQQAFETPGTESLLIQEGPGEYVVSVGFAGSDYSVTVDECGGGNASVAPPAEAPVVPPAEAPVEAPVVPPA